MNLLKEKITLIRQDNESKNICSVVTISSDSVNLITEDKKIVLVDCDLDSVLIIDEFEFGKMTLISSVEGFSFSGLLPVIAIDQESKILMQAFLNREALIETFKTGFANYFSRSRGKIWLKGESSDHKQEIMKVEYSEEGAFFVYTVKQNIAACHDGFYSCFYRQIREDRSFQQIDFDRKFKPEKVYGL